VGRWQHPKEGLLKSVKSLVPHFANNPSEILLWQQWYQGRVLGQSKLQIFIKGVSGDTHLAAIFN
jgi:hypothetical protein